MSKFVENIDKWPIFLDFPYDYNVNLYSRMEDKHSKGSNSNTLKIGSIVSKFIKDQKIWTTL